MPSISSEAMAARWPPHSLASIKHFVGDDVQLLLDFTLHVLAVGGSQYAAQCALVDGQTDAFAGASDDFEQQAQLRGMWPRLWRCCSTR
jgi:hypothetical protein